MGITPVLYLKHNPELAKRLEAIPGALDALRRFVERDDDLGSFAELRMEEPLPVQHAVWLLTTANKDPRESAPALATGTLRNSRKNMGGSGISHWSR